MTRALPSIVTRTALRSCRVLSILWLATLASACAAGNRAPADPNEVFRNGMAYVRLVPVEPGSPENNHPATVSVKGLRTALAKIQVSGAVAVSGSRLFSDEELDPIVQPLAKALAQAEPQQDIVFAAVGPRGIFGSASLPAVTTARLFVRDQRVNLILGIVQERIGDKPLAGSTENDLVPGTRARRIEHVWTIDPDTAEFHDTRGDWLTFALPSPTTADSSDAATGAEGRYLEIEQRLQVLERLKSKGLITEEEYSEQRRSILQGI